MDDITLRSYATVRQTEYLDAVEQHGSQRAAAAALGVAESTLRMSLKALRKKAEMRSAGEDTLAGATSTSTLYDADGNVALQWVKKDLKSNALQEAFSAALDTFRQDYKPVAPSAPPLDRSTDVIPWIQIGDAHLGLVAWAFEVGENFDLEIAERELCGAVGILIDEMPACERVVINDLADFTHYENYSAVTEASGHQLDFDSRFPRMIRTYSRVMRFIVDKALTKAMHVDVIVNQGNHSRTNDVWMAELLRVAYEHTGRVHVLNNDSVFIGYRMGNTFVMTHHSDKCKPARLANVLMHDFRKDFGETEHHYIDIGHVHHGMVMKEHPSVFVESFNHLAATDKWAFEAGYRNRKSITVVLRSKTYGEIGRRVLPIQEVRDRVLGCSQVAPIQAYTV